MYATIAIQHTTLRLVQAVTLIVNFVLLSVGIFYTTFIAMSYFTYRTSYKSKYSKMQIDNITKPRAVLRTIYVKFPDKNSEPLKLGTHNIKFIWDIDDYIKKIIGDCTS